MPETRQEQLLAEAADSIRKHGVVDLVTLMAVQEEGWEIPAFLADAHALADQPAD